MNTTQRKWQPSRNAWAASRARELRAQASQVRAERIPSGNWRGVRRKMDALARLEREAARLEMIAVVDTRDDENLPF